MAMARLLELEELVDHFTLTPGELGLLRNKAGATRLGFGVLLKFVQWNGRFPAGRGELPENAIGHVARQVGVAESEIARYDFDGRQIKAHRAEIRRELGLRECSVRDAEQLAVWLVEHVCERERHPDIVRDELLARCRVTGVEPPARTRVERIVASALRRAEDALFARVSSRPGPDVLARVETMIGAADDGDLDDADGMSVFAAIRADPGGLSLNTMLAEVEKLLAVRAVGVPAGMFADVAPKILAAWRARAAAEASEPCHQASAEVVHVHAPKVNPSFGDEHPLCREQSCALRGLEGSAAGPASSRPCFDPARRPSSLASTACQARGRRHRAKRPYRSRNPRRSSRTRPACEPARRPGRASGRARQARPTDRRRRSSAARRG
jgi:Domain of unknown function (DUF4158)